MDLRRRAKFRAKIWTRVERPVDDWICYQVNNRLWSRVYHDATLGQAHSQPVAQALALICRQAAEDTDGDSGWAVTSDPSRTRDLGFDP